MLHFLFILSARYCNFPDHNLSEEEAVVGNLVQGDRHCDHGEVDVRYSNVREK